METFGALLFIGLVSFSIPILNHKTRQYRKEVQDSVAVISEKVQQMEKNLEEVNQKLDRLQSQQ